jgi:protein FAM161A
MNIFYFIQFYFEIHSVLANPVPNHVHMPLYEQLQEEQRIRREQVHHMTKEYLSSISKPFGFDAREKAKTILRRHSYSGGDTIRPGSRFKAKPMPDFYYQTPQENEQYEINIFPVFILVVEFFRLKEKSMYRSIRRDIRAKELLRQSRLPFSKQETKRPHRSMSVNDIARAGYEEYSFKPKTNGYYIPNYDKIHSKFLNNMEQKKRTRSPTKCKPFLLYTNLIPSKKDKILDDIRNDAQIKHSQTFQIKGKQMPTKSIPSMSLSASLQQSESIPTKMTEAQRLREGIGKKKRRDEETKSKFEENFQRSKSAKERRLRETIHQRTNLQDQAIVSRAKRDENVKIKY